MISIDRRALVREVIAALRDDDTLRRELAVALGREEQSRLVSPAQYARKFGIATSTVRKAIASGRLDAIKVGRSVRIAVDATIAPRSATAGDTATSRAEHRLGLIAGGRK